MSNSGIITLIIIIANVIFSSIGFKNETFFDGYKFEVDKILISKDYKRIISSGFLHLDWKHLIFNMFTLFVFSGALESQLGILKYIIVYFASLIGGNLLALFVHRNHGDYSAVGASGAVCGLVFASIALFPGIDVGFFILPFSIPGWLYGLVYVLYSIYGIKSKKDNVGHEAHLGGALIGMLVALILVPSAIVENYVTILIIAVPIIAFIYLIVTRPHILMVDNLFFKNNNNNYDIDHKYNEDRTNKQKEIDKILDKIGSKGMDSLSNREKEMLKDFS